MRVRNAVVIGIFGAVALAAILLSNPAVTQLNPMKVAVIDTERVFNEYVETKKAQEQIDKAIARLESEGTALDDEIKKLEDRLSKQRLFIEDEAKVRQMEQEIIQKGQQLQALVDTGQAALAAKEQELSEPILKKIRETIRAYGEAEGYDLIQEKRLIVLYHRPGMDITDTILGQLNAGAETANEGADTTAEEDAN